MLMPGLTGAGPGVLGLRGSGEMVTAFALPWADPLVVIRVRLGLMW